jgi:chromosome segregation ATPase
MTATRQEYERAMHERTKLEHDVEAFAELRGAHSQVQQEYYDLKMEVTRSRNEVMKLGNTLAQKNSREMELERELAQASAARQKAMDREVAALQKADDASMKMNKALYAEEYLRKELLRLEDEKVKMSHELRETKRERDTLKKLAEKKGKPKSPKRKNSTRSGVPRPQ